MFEKQLLTICEYFQSISSPYVRAIGWSFTQTCEDVVEEALAKTKQALILSSVSSVGATSVHFISNQIAQMKDPEEIEQEDSFYTRLKQKAKKSASRSAIASSASFVSKTGINFVTGGSNVAMNVGAKVVADGTTKFACEHLPQYLGAEPHAWGVVFSKAATSALVGTLSYHALYYLTGAPLTSRLISAGISATVEQGFDAYYTPPKCKRC